MAVTDLTGVKWHNGDGWFDMTGGPPALALGATTYTAADIAAWTTGTAFSALDARFASGLRDGDSITDYGTTIVEADMADFRTLTRQIKSQAVLHAEGSSVRDATYASNVTSFLDGLKDVTSWTGDTGQVNLEGAWIVIDAVQAAQITGYSDPDFDTFLEDVCYKSTKTPSTTFGLDWSGNGNWVLAFAVARMHIASYLQNFTLWADAVDYFEWHLERTVYHSTYDGANVVPLRDDAVWPDKKTGTISSGLMDIHWNNEIIRESPTDTWPAEYSNHDSDAGDWTTKTGDMADGTHCEAKRRADYEHWNAILACMGGMVAANVGHELSANTTARIEALAEYAAGRIWAYANTSTTPTDPVWEDGVSDAQKYRGWHVVARYFEVVGKAIPSDVSSLLADSAVTSISQKEGEVFHGASEYADGSLLS